jgi:hypothetical protein
LHFSLPSNPKKYQLGSRLHTSQHGCLMSLSNAMPNRLNK